MANVEEVLAPQPEPVQAPAVGPHPEDLRPVLEDRPDAVGREALGVCRVVTVHRRHSRLAVEPDEAPAVGGDPEEALVVLGERLDEVAREPGGARAPHQPVPARVPHQDAATVRPHPERSRSILEKRRDESRTRPARLGRNVNEDAPCRVETVQATSVRPHPEGSGTIHEEGPHVVVREARRIAGVVPEPLETARPGVEAREAPTLRPDPDPPVAVLAERADGVRGETGRVGGVVPKARDVARRRIEPVQPSLEGPDPDHPGTVLHEALQLVVGEAPRVSRDVPEDGETIAVPSVQAVLRGEPEESAPVLEASLDDALREPLRQGELLERHRRGGGEGRQLERSEGREDAARGPHVTVYGSRARRFVLRKRRETLTPGPSPGTLAP